MTTLFPVASVRSGGLAAARGARGPAATVTSTARTAAPEAFTAATAARSSPEATLVGLRTPMQNSVGRVTFEWRKPGDVIPFEVTARVDGDPNRVRAQLHTNANHNDDPSLYDDIEMTPGPARNGYVTFRAEVPIEKLGNYRATARLLVDGKVAEWAGDVGIEDVRFRPRAQVHSGLNIREINIHNINSNGHGTLEDLMGSGSPETDGQYTLEFLRKQGVNSVWVMPPFKRSKWEFRYPGDDAGSPYATKNYFEVDPEFSSKAMALRAQGASEEEVVRAANEAFKEFTDKAHALGMKVICDVALNHVGHNFEFADYDLISRTVRANDYSQFVAPNSEQAKLIAQRLADPNLPDYAEYIAPELLYSSKSGNARGASSVSDTMAGGGQWFDTKQLKTGGPYGAATPDGQKKVVDYLSRVLQYWVTEMGVDGFRLDHLSGLPDELLEEVMNKAQASADRYRQGEPLYFTGEDFENPAWHAAWLDSVQDTWLRNALRDDPSPETIRELLLNDHFKRRELLSLNSHDETRFDFGGDYQAAARLNATLQLLGGSTVTVAGDEFGEGLQMAFKQYKPIQAIQHPTPAGEIIRERMARAGLARDRAPVLQDDNTIVLRQKAGGDDPDLLALARVPDQDAAGNPVFVFSNFNNARARENAFTLDTGVKERIDPKAQYQIRDLLADDPNTDIWSAAKSGQELLDQGLFARLDPHQVQALELRKL